MPLPAQLRRESNRPSQTCPAPVRIGRERQDDPVEMPIGSQPRDVEPPEASVVVDRQVAELRVGVEPTLFSSAPRAATSNPSDRRRGSWYRLAPRTR